MSTGDFVTWDRFLREINDGEESYSAAPIEIKVDGRSVASFFSKKDTPYGAGDATDLFVADSIKADSMELPSSVSRVIVGVGKQGEKLLINGAIHLVPAISRAAIFGLMTDYADLKSNYLSIPSTRQKAVGETLLMIDGNPGLIAKGRTTPHKGHQVVSFNAQKRRIRERGRFSLFDLKVDDFSLAMVKDFCFFIAQQSLLLDRNLKKESNAEREFVGTIAFKRARHVGSDLEASSEHTEVGLDKFVGYPELKERLREFIFGFSHPEVYADFGVDNPRSFLLYGNPGVGKTTIARHVAEEIDADLTVVDSKVHSMWLHESERKIRALFEEVARRDGPQVIFLDELDGLTNSGNDNADLSFVKTMGTAIEAARKKKEDLLIIAAANDIDNVPLLLRRTGRFDEKIYVTTPRVGDFEELLFKRTVSQKEGLFEGEYNFNELAALAVSREMTIKDMESVIEKLKRTRARQSHAHQGNFSTISQTDLYEAIESFHHH